MKDLTDGKAATISLRKDLRFTREIAFHKERAHHVANLDDIRQNGDRVRIGVSDLERRLAPLDALVRARRLALKRYANAEVVLAEHDLAIRKHGLQKQNCRREELNLPRVKFTKLRKQPNFLATCRTSKQSSSNRYETFDRYANAEVILAEHDLAIR